MELYILALSAQANSDLMKKKKKKKRAFTGCICVELPRRLDFWQYTHMPAHKPHLLLFLGINQGFITLLARKCPHKATQLEFHCVTTSKGTVD